MKSLDFIVRRDHSSRAERKPNRSSRVRVCSKWDIDAQNVELNGGAIASMRQIQSSRRAKTSA